MKFQSGQTVIILNTEYKPAGSAVVRSYNEISNQYEVDYQYPDDEQPRQIYIPEERLLDGMISQSALNFSR